jgi:hypothetical protein
MSGDFTNFSFLIISGDPHYAIQPLVPGVIPARRISLSMPIAAYSGLNKVKLVFFSLVQLQEPVPKLGCSLARAPSTMEIAYFHGKLINMI